MAKKPKPRRRKIVKQPAVAQPPFTEHWKPTGGAVANGRTRYYDADEVDAAWVAVGATK